MYAIGKYILLLMVQICESFLTYATILLKKLLQLEMF